MVYAHTLFFCKKGCIFCNWAGKAPVADAWCNWSKNGNKTKFGLMAAAAAAAAAADPMNGGMGCCDCCCLTPFYKKRKCLNSRKKKKKQVVFVA